VAHQTIYEIAGPFLIPVALFVAGVVGYLLLRALLSLRESAG